MPSDLHTALLQPAAKILGLILAAVARGDVQNDMRHTVRGVFSILQSMPHYSEVRGALHALCWIHKRVERIENVRSPPNWCVFVLSLIIPHCVVSGLIADIELTSLRKPGIDSKFIKK